MNQPTLYYIIIFILILNYIVFFYFILYYIIGRSGRQGLKSVKEIIENFGSWPLFSNDDDSEIQVWPSISEAYGDLIGESVFFNIKRLKGKGSAILNVCVYLYNV